MTCLNSIYVVTHTYRLLPHALFHIYSLQPSSSRSPTFYQTKIDLLLISGPSFFLNIFCYYCFFFFSVKIRARILVNPSRPRVDPRDAVEELTAVVLRNCSSSSSSRSVCIAWTMKVGMVSAVVTTSSVVVQLGGDGNDNAGFYRKCTVGRRRGGAWDKKRPVGRGCNRRCPTVPCTGVVRPSSAPAVHRTSSWFPPPVRWRWWSMGGRAGVRVCAPGGDGVMQFFDSLMHVAHFVFSKDDGPTNLNERSSCIQMHCARMHQRAVATTSK